VPRSTLRTRQRAKQAVREADRAEAEAWSIRMEGYGGPAQPSPTIAQWLNGGLGWLEVECNRCTAAPPGRPLATRKYLTLFGRRL
jgi:hypothetical protein